MAWALRQNYEGYQAFEDQERENLEAHQRQVNHMYHQEELEAHNSRGSGSGCYMPVRELGSTSFSAIPVTSPSFPSCLRHHRLFILRTVHYRLSSSLRLSSFVLFFVTDLFRPCHVPSIILRFCGCTILL